MKNILFILLTFVLFLPNSIAQSSPGGISSDLKLWLDAKDDVTLNGVASTNAGSIDTWVNQVNNPGCIDLYQTNAAERPTYRTNSLNFNPIVEFDGVNDQLERSVLGSDIFDPSNNTIFFVHKCYENSGAHVYFKWEIGASGIATRFGFETSGLFTRIDFPNGVATNQTSGTFTYNTSGQIVTGVTGASSTSIRNMGLQNVVNPTTGVLNTGLTNLLSIGENSSFPLATQIDFAEIIIYKETLSASDLNKVESYLAIKYGMTLGINGTSLNYNSSGGNVIWDASSNSGYNFDIAGISRDDLTDQDQRKSKSINLSILNPALFLELDILTIANDTNFNNPLAFGSDMSHLIWGNNNASINMNDTITFPTVNAGMLNTLLDRHWKSQETGTVDKVTLQFDMTNVTGFNTWSNIKLLVNTDSNFTIGATSISPSMIDSTGALTIEFKHDFSNTEGFYFTLATTTPLNITNPLPIIACDSFTLPPITGAALVNPQYYSDTSGTGVIILPGAVIISDTVIYLYDQTGGVPNQFDQDTLNITINMTQTSTDNQTACDTYTWINGNTYNSSNNTASVTLTAANGCDSIVTLDLTINNSSTSTDTQVACDAYTWSDGNTYTASNNTATQIFTNAAGCDSTLTLNLTINNSSTGTDVHVACAIFNWIDGNVYTSSNNSATYTITAGSANGCDSIITLNLTVFPVLAINLGEDQFICNDPILLSLGENFNSYLWSDNSTNSTLLANTPGVYSLTVTDINNCPASDNIKLIDDCPSNLWVPNVFSPNGDNQNDIFNVVLEKAESFSMKIFNRWGAPVFETNSLTLGWNGEKNGKKVSEGTYFYVIEYSFYKQSILTSEVVKGSLSLLK